MNKREQTVRAAAFDGLRIPSVDGDDLYVTDTMRTSGSMRQDHPEPLWIQAVNLINDQIASGVLKPGSRLPPERELCQRLGISRVTLRKALTTLVDDGVLSPSHGRGWYVASSAGTNREWPNSLESFSETASRMGLSATSIVLRSEVVPASIDEAEELSIAPGTALFVLERVRQLNDVPIALDLTRIRADLVPNFESADWSTDSLYAKLVDAGLDPAKSDATIEAREADEHVAQHLLLQAGKPVLVINQLVVNSADKPLFASTVRYRGDRYRLRTFFLRSPAFARPSRAQQR
jgi:GntR family transcriptional regulator